MTYVSPNRLRELIFFMLTGKRSHRPPIIRIHNRHSQGCTGDLSFPYNIEPWKNCIDAEPEEFDGIEDILTYYKDKTLDNPKSDNWDVDSILSAFKREFVQNYNELFRADPASISTLFELALLANDTVAVVFHVTRLSHFVIKHVLVEGVYYGHKAYRSKRFRITVDELEGSEITNFRLDLLRRAIKNLLKSQGWRSARENGYCTTHYLLSTNDQLMEKDQDFKYEIIRCAKVLHNVKWVPHTKTRDMYLRHKMKKIREMHEQRCHEIYIDAENAEKDIIKYASAAATHELCTEDYFESVLLESSTALDSSTIDAVYILNTNVRITSILDKYARLVVRDEFPRIPDLHDLPCLERSGDVASWHMIFHYIVDFPDVLEKTLYDNPKLNINIPLLWKFCYDLCKDFNKYYENHPVILTGPDSTEKSNFEITTERIYILKALRIVLRDALFLLGVEEVTYM